MHRTGRTADNGFKDRGLMRNIDIKVRAAFGRSAVSEQARRHAAEAVLPLRDDGPPGYAGAAGSRHEYDRRPLSAFIIVDASKSIFDHDVLPFRVAAATLAPTGRANREPRSVGPRELAFDQDRSECCIRNRSFAFSASASSMSLR